MNTYEALFIFPELLNAEEVEVAQTHVLSEIERHSGKVCGVRRIGRRDFARPIRKQRSGLYSRVVFELDGCRIAELRARYRLSDDVFRVQITRGDGNSIKWVQDPESVRSRAESKDGREAT